MRKILYSLIAILALPVMGKADICSDLKTLYNTLIQNQYKLASDASSITTDAYEQQAIWQSFEITKASLEAEMESTLLANGCKIEDPVVEPPVTEPPTTEPPTTEPPTTEPPTTEPPTTEPPTTEPPTSPTPTPTPTEPPTTEPPTTKPPTTEPPTTKPPTTEPPTTKPPTTEPPTTEPPVTQPPQSGEACDALVERLKAEGMALQGNKPGFDKITQHLRAHKAEVIAACGNFGSGRSKVGGNGHGRGR